MFGAGHPKQPLLPLLRLRIEHEIDAPLGNARQLEMKVGPLEKQKKLQPFPFSDLKKKESLLIERFWELWCPNGQFEQPEFLRTASMIMDEFS